jgi:hypothetical protein
MLEWKSMLAFRPPVPSVNGDMPRARASRARRRAPAAALAVAAALAAGAALSGCGDIDGGHEPFAGTSLYQDTSGAYQLRLLEPPWFPPIAPLTFFFVPPSETLTSVPNETDALYTLHVNGADGDPAGALAASAAAANPPWDLSQKRAVQAVSGASGAEISWDEGAASPQRFHREVFLAAPAGPTFHLHFSAKKAIADDGMVTQMVLSFAPRGTTASGSP